MSMYEQAVKINVSLLNTMKDVDDDTKKDLLNILIRFGQVAKFRCRSNIAYKNFVDACFTNLAKAEEIQRENLDFKTLEVVEVLKSEVVNVPTF